MRARRTSLAADRRQEYSVVNNPIILHCNYVEQGQTIDQMCERAVRWGYEGVEFRSRSYGVADQDPIQYLDALAKAQKQTGLKHVLFGGPGPDLMQADKDARQKDVDWYIEFFRNAAKRFEPMTHNTMAGPLTTDEHPYSHYEKHGSALGTDELYEQAAGGFRQLGQVADELGIRFAFETHMGYIHDLAAPAKKLCDLIGHKSVGINLDYGNISAYNGGPSLADSVKDCGDRLYMLHLKNAFYTPGKQHDHMIKCSLADGVINNREFMMLVKNAGFDGPIVIEAPRPGDREWFAQEDIAYLKSVIAELS
jgi:sugar phosphate isomerase/epimerase